MVSGKIEMQKYSKIHKGTKNVKNTHILRSLPILHFFGLFKFFGASYGLDVVWIGLLHLEGGRMISGKIEMQKY